MYAVMLANQTLRRGPLADSSMEKANREKESPLSDKAQAGSSEDPPADVGTALLDELAAIRSRREILGQDNDDTPPDGSLRTASVNEKLAAYYRAVHALEDLSALCLSGGGICSAAFALGVIQGLAARGLLKQFDYLSTVSGGGYLGSLLTAWVQREGYDAVCRNSRARRGRRTRCLRCSTFAVIAII